MKWLNRLERRMGRRYIPNLMCYLCLAMLGVFILDYLNLPRSATELFYFNRDLILQGQVWRVVTFLFLPPTGSIVWIIFNLYFYYFIGTSLESHWGGARFNLYYLIGTLGAIAGGFICGVTTSHYLNLSLMLSFAVLYPDTEFLLFFFLPVKARWLGVFWGAYLVYQLIVMPWMFKVIIVLSLLPFVLFVGRQAWLQTRMDFRHFKYWLSQQFRR